MISVRKHMSLFDSDIDAAGVAMLSIALSWPDDLPEGLEHVTHQIAADVAHLRRQCERGRLTDTDVEDIQASRPMVNRALYNLYKDRQSAPQIFYTIDSSGQPEIGVRGAACTDLAPIHEAAKPIPRPPGRPRLMTRAELENTVFMDARTARNMRRRLLKDDP